MSNLPESDDKAGAAVPTERIPVLDGGFVRVVDVMGGDGAVVQAARISYGKGTKSLSEDRGLIRYLMRQRHTTPFEMCEIKLHVRVPMDCWRQWIRHRTASVNEYSTRYSEAIDAAQETAADSWRSQSNLNKQGSSHHLDEATGGTLSRRERELLALARVVYEERLSAGVSREQARKDLPLSTYTEAYWKIDLHNLLHFLELRMDAHAQYEIRQYAVAIGEQIVSRWVPLTWEAFRDYRIGSLVLSSADIALIRLLGSRDSRGALDMASSLGWIDHTTGKRLRSRECDEFESKVRRMGLACPWTEDPIG